MAAGDDPSNRELDRRLAEMEGDHKDLARIHAEDMRDIHRQLSDAKEASDRKFMRKDVYAEARRADQAVVADQADDIRNLKDRFKSDDAFRRQVLFGLSIAAISSLTAIAVAVFTLLAR